MKTSNTCHFYAIFAGGAGARDNRGGREGYGRREKKGRKAWSLRWREAGEKFKKASFCYLLLLTSSQRNEPNNVSWLPFNVLRGLKQNFIREKSPKRKVVLGVKKYKKALPSVKLKTFPSRLHHRTWMRWHDTCTLGTCVDCVSRVSVSSVWLAVEILRKNNKASQIKCRQRPFWWVSDSSVWWGKILPWKTFLGARSVQL